MGPVRTCGRFLPLAAFLAANAVAATYHASVEASIQTVNPSAVLVGGPDLTFFADYFSAEIPTGNADFQSFCGCGEFSSEEQRLSLRLGGPSGFANPYGVSRSGGSEQNGPAVLKNLTDEALLYPLLLDYAFSVSASAAANETASASIEFDLLARSDPTEPLESLFHIARAFSQNGSDSENTSLFVDVPLDPGREVELFLRMRTFGEAVAVPEPGTLLTGSATLTLLLICSARFRRRYSGFNVQQSKRFS